MRTGLSKQAQKLMEKLAEARSESVAWNKRANEFARELKEVVDKDVQQIISGVAVPSFKARRTYRKRQPAGNAQEPSTRKTSGRKASTRKQSGNKAVRTRTNSRSTDPSVNRAQPLRVGRVTAKIRTQVLDYLNQGATVAAIKTMMKNNHKLIISLRDIKRAAKRAGYTFDQAGS